MPLAARLAHSERYLNRPTPAPFAGLPLYDGPNHPAKVGWLVTAASRMARGAFEDAMGIVCMLADDWREPLRKRLADDTELSLLLEQMDPKTIHELLLCAREMSRAA